MIEQVKAKSSPEITYNEYDSCANVKARRVLSVRTHFLIVVVLQVSRPAMMAVAIPQTFSAWRLIWKVVEFLRADSEEPARNLAKVAAAKEWPEAGGTE